MLKTGNLNKLIGKLAVTALLVLGVSACNQILDVKVPQFANKSSLSVPESTLKTVNRTFYASLLGGDWYYQGAQARNGEVYAYIQIPQKLDMAHDVQVRYLKMSVCPKKDKVELWNSLKDVSLAVHIYTYTKSKSVRAYCDNPWRNEAATA